jgi:hypothetical protein
VRRPGCQLEGHAFEDHNIVLADGTLLLLTQDRVEINAVERHEGAGGVGERVCELGVVVREGLLDKIGVGGGVRRVGSLLPCTLSTIPAAKQ